MNLNIGNIGVWGFKYYEFIKQNRPSTIGVMRLNGTLENYLKEVNQEATEMLETLIRQYTKAEGVTTHEMGSQTPRLNSFNYSFIKAHLSFANETMAE